MALSAFLVPQRRNWAIASLSDWIIGLQTRLPMTQ
jgi:hypothetical protein